MQALGTVTRADEGMRALGDCPACKAAPEDRPWPHPRRLGTKLKMLNINTKCEAPRWVPIYQAATIQHGNVKLQRRKALLWSSLRHWPPLLDPYFDEGENLGDGVIRVLRRL